MVAAACTAGRRHRASAPTTTTTARTPATSTTAPAAASLPDFVTHGPRDKPAIALTFHGSGDVALLDQLLAVAADHKAVLTIFAVGRWLDANPAVARRILAAGHELANHTYTHPNLGQVSAQAARTEVGQCADALRRHAGTAGRWFRPSGIPVPTATITAAAAAEGYPTIVGYDVDPHDYQDPGAAAVRTRVAAGLQPGSIVSLHTGHAGTVAALQGILADAAARGLHPTTVTQLLRA